MAAYGNRFCGELIPLQPRQNYIQRERIGAETDAVAGDWAVRKEDPQAFNSALANLVFVIILLFPLELTGVSLKATVYGYPDWKATELRSQEN